jgi:GNAT superfamily N-acetyltransferase
MTLNDRSSAKGVGVRMTGEGGVPVPEPGAREPSTAHTIEVVAESDLGDLLPLMRAYCDFYAVAPSDAALLQLVRALIAEPQREGLQLIARMADGGAIGFATLLWSWSTTAASRIGIMYDLYVRPDARRMGVATRLIGVCLDRCAQQGVATLEWQTAPDNLTAQAVYDRAGGSKQAWINYSIAVR